jgi:acetylornithine deacetylase/succinyl-diaminopimelate desuccinylase-like protein
VATDRMSDPTAVSSARAREELERLVRIPSVAFPGFPPEPVLEAAHATAEILQDAGTSGVRLLELPGGYPAVFGEIAAPPGAPTVLLYAHYDVQPAGPEELWSTPPFEPVMVDGRLHGRGAGDDKSGIVVHAAAIRAYGGRPPVGVKILIEGEEEATTEHLPTFIRDNRELLAADVVVVADSGNRRTGEPTLTTTIRGVVDCTVQVRALEVPVHSGSFGGAAPDALVALIRMLATLHDDRGNTTVKDLVAAPWTGTEMLESEFREEARVLDGVRLVGDGALADRIWTRPAVNVIGIDAPTVRGARNILVDVARAQVSLRVAPGDDPGRAIEAVARHLESAAPWGVRVSVERGEPGLGYAAPTDGPAYAAARRALEKAYGRPVVEMGSGGSVPLIPVIARTYPESEILLMGAMDHRCNAHAQDESVDLAEVARAARGEALLIRELAAG